MNIILNRWFQLGAASIIAVVIGAAIGTSLSPSAVGEVEEIAALVTPREKVLLTAGDAPKHRFEGPVGYRGMRDGPSRPNTLGKLERLA